MYMKIDVAYTSENPIPMYSCASECTSVFIKGYVCKVFMSLYVSFSVR